MGHEQAGGKESGVQISSLDDILQGIDVDGGAKDIAEYLDGYFSIHNPSLENGNLYKWMMRVGVGEEKSSTVLELLKQREGERVITESRKQQGDLEKRLDRVSKGLLCVEKEFPLDHIALKLKNTKNPKEQQQYNRAVFRTLKEKDFTEEEIKNVLLALKGGTVDSKEAQAIASSMGNKYNERKVEDPNTEAFSDKYTKQPKFESKEQESFQERYALFGNSKQDIYDALQEMKEKGFLSEVQEKILFSAQSHLYDIRHQKMYWKSGGANTPFVDGIKTPTCGGGVAYHLKQAGIPIPKNPLWAESFSKGGEKIGKEQAIPGDVVVYSKRVVNGKDVGGHVGIILGYENGQMLIWSENIGVASDVPGQGKYIGPIVHPIDGLASMGISNPKIYRHR